MKATASVLQVNFFFVLVKSCSISHVYFAVHYGKSFDPALLFLFVSVDHLFDNLDSRKKKFLFWEKSGKKNCVNPNTNSVHTCTNTCTNTVNTCTPMYLHIHGTSQGFLDLTTRGK